MVVGMRAADRADLKEATMVGLGTAVKVSLKVVVRVAAVREEGAQAVGMVEGEKVEGEKGVEKVGWVAARGAAGRAAE